VPETLPIAVASLVIDTKNPRLPKPNLGQNEAQREIAQPNQRYLLTLAKDIVRFGLNLAELPIVMEMKDDPLRRYVVLEGNRRLVALRALENPEWLIGIFPPALLSEMRATSRQYLQNPIASIECLIVKDREEARHWIELRHGGLWGGAGIVKWGSQETDRFNQRTRPLRIHMQVLDYLERRGDLTDEQRRKIPAASLRRLLETPVVALKIGVKLEDGQLKFLGDESRVVKALMYVIDGLTRSGDDKVKTKDIYTIEDRQKYAANLPSNIVVKSPAKGVKAAAAATATQTQTKRTVSTRPPQPRDQLIPPDCVLNVTDQRIRDIESELRKLSLNHHTNAVSVLFRVFVELSCDSYIMRWNLPWGDGYKLSRKLQDVANHLVNRGQLNTQQAKPVRLAAEKDKYLAASISVFNEYVHNQFIFPEPTDLRASWNSLQPFFIALWSV
jgi:hypothetical protein